MAVDVVQTGEPLPHASSLTCGKWQGLQSGKRKDTTVTWLHSSSILKTVLPNVWSLTGKRNKNAVIKRLTKGMISWGIKVFGIPVSSCK